MCSNESKIPNKDTVIEKPCGEFSQLEMMIFDLYMSTCKALKLLQSGYNFRTKACGHSSFPGFHTSLKSSAYAQSKSQIDFAYFPRLEPE